MTQSSALRPSRREAAISRFVNRCGGDIAIRTHLAAHGRPISQFAVRKWLKHGIPDRHWSELAKLAGVDAMELYQMHELPA